MSYGKHILIILLLQLTITALAQQTLVVNGEIVTGLTTSLVPGTSYVVVESYAQAIGADYRYNPATRLVSFELGARIASLQIYDTVAEATAAARALEIDGQAIPSPGGIISAGLIYVPVRSLAVAFGGGISYLSDRNAVVVVFPRANLIEARPPDGGPSDYERFVLAFDAPAPIQEYFNAALNTVQFRFERSSLAKAERFSGSFFSDATLVPNADRVDFTLVLKPGYSYEAFRSPQGSGFGLVIDLFPDETEPEISGDSQRVIVIDPGHGGQDSGLEFLAAGSESSLSLDFAKRLATALQEKSLNSTLTRESDLPLSLNSRSNMGIGADLFISIHAAALLPGQINIYYLGEAEQFEGLMMAIRANAETAAETLSTDSIRRRILLDLVPNLELGRTFANRLSSELAQAAGYNTVKNEAAPLSVLSGAAGRGLLLELSPEDLASAELPTTLAAIITLLLSQGGLN